MSVEDVEVVLYNGIRAYQLDEQSEFFRYAQLLRMPNYQIPPFIGSSETSVTAFLAQERERQAQ